MYQPETPAFDSRAPRRQYHPYHEFLCQPQRGGSATLVPLFKEDFEVIRGCGLKLNDPRFIGREMFVVFVVNYCPDCQDTKQMWQSYAVNVPISSLTSRRVGRLEDVCTQRIQWIMLKRADGRLVDFSGRLDTGKLTAVIAPLQQGYPGDSCFE